MQLSGQFEKITFQKGQKINFSRKISADYTNTIHWHPFVEMLLCLNQGNEVTVNFTTFSLSQNDILILLPGDLHSIHNRTDDSFLIIQFPLPLLSSFSELSPLLRALSKRPLIQYDPRFTKNDQLIYEFKALFDLNDSETSFREMLICSRILWFFGLLGEHVMSSLPDQLSVQENSQYKSAKMIAEACMYISSHCSEPLTLEGVSHSIGISKSYFSHLFKDYTKMTFIDFLTAERIKKAEGLFVDSHIKIIDIAFECGFTSISSFNRAFKKTKGISPTEFRKISISKY